MRMHRHGRHGCRTPFEDVIPLKMARRGFGDFGGFGGFGWDGEHRRGEGRRRRFSGAELRLVLLKLIADQPRHGYELIKALEELTDGAYAPSPGTVYPTLSLLEDEGAIAEAADAAETKRKAFEATAAGRAELEEKAEEVAGLMARLAELGAKRERTNWPELWRATTNLGSVLKNRMRAGGLAGGLDADVIREIVDIIDDAAKRIERI